MLNDKDNIDKFNRKGHKRSVSRGPRVDSETDLFDIDDSDLISDKDKYSEWYGLTSNHYNFKKLPDIRFSNEFITDEPR